MFLFHALSPEPEYIGTEENRFQWNCVCFFFLSHISFPQVCVLNSCLLELQVKTATWPLKSFHTTET